MGQRAVHGGGDITAWWQAGASQFTCAGGACQLVPVFDLVLPARLWRRRVGATPQGQRVLRAHQQRRQLNSFDGICGNAVSTQTLGAEITCRKDGATQEHRGVGVA